MRRHSRAEHIYFGENTPVYLSASVAQVLGGRCGLWRGEGALALVTHPEGPFRVCDKPNSRAKFINARSLAQYLCGRFPKAGGMVSAWADEAHGAVLFAMEERRGEAWDGDFAPVDLSGLSSHRNYQVFRDRVKVSLAMPRRVSAFARGSAVALLRDPQGPYFREREAGETFLRSAPLAAYLRREWGDRRPYIRETEGGIVLSPGFVELADLEGLEGFEPLSLEADGKTATLCRDHSILLSQEAARALGGSASVYTCSGMLALRSDRRGDVAVKRREGSSVLLSARLYQQAAMSSPGVETFHLVPNGGLWVLSPQEEQPSIPPEDYFCRMLVGSGGER